jgi:hypothetical protein
MELRPPHRLHSRSQAADRHGLGGTGGEPRACERPSPTVSHVGKLTGSSRIINSNLLQKRSFPCFRDYTGSIIFCPRTQIYRRRKEILRAVRQSAGRLGVAANQK